MPLRVAVIVGTTVKLIDVTMAADEWMMSGCEDDRGSAGYALVMTALARVGPGSVAAAQAAL